MFYCSNFASNRVNGELHTWDFFVPRIIIEREALWGRKRNDERQTHVTRESNLRAVEQVSRLRKRVLRFIPGGLAVAGAFPDPVDLGACSIANLRGIIRNRSVPLARNIRGKKKSSILSRFFVPTVPQRFSKILFISIYCRDFFFFFTIKIFEAKHFFTSLDRERRAPVARPPVTSRG